MPIQRTLRAIVAVAIAERAVLKVHLLVIIRLTDISLELVKHIRELLELLFALQQGVTLLPDISVRLQEVLAPLFTCHLLACVHEEGKVEGRG